MSKKFKSQASSARAASVVFGSNAFRPSSPANFQTASSPLSYISELPDLRGISDATIVVAFKNLGKKDSTTKAKALEELQDHLTSLATSETGIESGLLEAWSGLYPRTSIDNSRRVRHLAHSIQGTLTVLSGRRIVPYLTKIIGSWLSGRFDSDRGVSRSVQEGLEKSFPSVDKRKALWKIYKDALLAYAEDAILSQTAQTLSDERTTSPDDAEAKHVRVAGNAILMVLQLLKSQDVAKAGSSDARITRLLTAERIWGFSYHSDSHLRRSVYSLLTFCISEFASLLNWTDLSTAVLSKSLHISQLGSSQQYSEVLLAMTSVHPQVWTSDYTAKTSVTRRLFQFLKQGSQRGSEEFWLNVGQIVRKIPVETWQQKGRSTDQISAADFNALLQAIFEGVTSSDEPRQNAGVAWTTYVEISTWVAAQIGDSGERNAFLNEHVSPLVTRQVTHKADLSRWSIPPVVSTRVCTQYLLILVSQDWISLLENIWSEQVGHLNDAMKLSLPESSNEFRSSQDSVIQESERFFALQAELKRTMLEKNVKNPTVEKMFRFSGFRLFATSLDVLKIRNGKPYGASGVVSSLIPLLNSEEKEQLFAPFLLTDLPALLRSPSGHRLLSALFLCRSCSTYPAGLKASVDSVLETPDSKGRSKALGIVIQNINADDLSRNPALSKFIVEELRLALVGDDSRWSLIYAFLQNPGLHLQQGASGSLENSEEQNFQMEIMSQLLNGLSRAATQGPALDGISGLLSTSGSANKLPESFAGTLLSKTLLLSDSADDDIADKAKKLTATLKSHMAKSGSATITNSTAQLLRDQFQGTAEPLSIFGFFEFARDTFNSSKSEDKPHIISTVLPTAEDWRNALTPFLSSPPLRSIAITSALQATVYVVEPTEASTSITLARDTEGFSTAFRLTFCVTRLLKSTDLLQYIDRQNLEILFEYLPQALELVNNKITLDSSNEIWLISTPEVLEEAAEVVADCRSQVEAWCESTQNSRGDAPSLARIDHFWIQQLQKIQELESIPESTAEAYHLAQAYTSVLSECVDLNGFSSYRDTFASDLKSLRRSENLIKSGSLVAVFCDMLSSSAEGRKLCNEMISDATELKDLRMTAATLRPFLILNILFQVDDDLVESIPTQRVVFLFQNLIRLLVSSDDHDTLNLKAEVFKLLFYIIPAVLEIYGEHWRELLSCFVDFWPLKCDLKDWLPTLHASFRLYARMSILVQRENANEDFIEEWTRHKLELSTRLIGTLTLFENPPAGTSQPRDVTTALLRRMLLNVNIEGVGHQKLYLLLNSREGSVQSAAYELLHRGIPKIQAQVSLDVALEKKTANLPSELISLIIDIPKMTPQTLEASSPRSDDFRRFFLGWNLVFDHFVNASYKLKDMYTAELKEANCMNGLLDLVCDTLRIPSGKPIDASKFDIKNFLTDGAESPQKELQWLIVHVYHNCLLYLPGLVKDWFIEQKNRIKSPLESWTQKHFSPLIVTEVLSTVSDWSTTQDPDDRPITIKSSPKGSELIASIAIDEESPPISLAITLPGAYPLEQVLVTSRNRVGVSEKNWQSWLRTFQIIIFSSGSLIEGLVAFRRNVQGALKGQSECAICYSIIGTDMKTPDKRCSTCKNTFHGVCLFKWFKSSNTSTCPLCRNNFNYA